MPCTFFHILWQSGRTFWFLESKKYLLSPSHISVSRIMVKKFMNKVFESVKTFFKALKTDLEEVSLWIMQCSSD